MDTEPRVCVWCGNPFVARTKSYVTICSHKCYVYRSRARADRIGRTMADGSIVPKVHRRKNMSATFHNDAQWNKLSKDTVHRLSGGKYAVRLPQTV